MSKFEDLCKVFSKARRTYFDYRTECCDLAVEIFRGISNYLQCPKDTVYFRPLKGNFDLESIYSPLGAAYLGEDGFWHFGVAIKIYEAPNIYPHEIVLLDVSIKKIEDYFICKVDYKQDFKIYKSELKDINTFCEFIFTKIKNFYEKGFQNFIEESGTVRKIGF